jgi:hypothetical protein
MSRTKQIAKNLFMGLVYSVLVWVFVSVGALGLILVRYELGDWWGSFVVVAAMAVAFAAFFTYLEGPLNRGLSATEADEGAAVIAKAAETDPKVKAFLQLAKRTDGPVGAHLYFDKEAAAAAVKVDEEPLGFEDKSADDDRPDAVRRLSRADRDAAAGVDADDDSS